MEIRVVGANKVHKEFEEEKNRERERKTQNRHTYDRMFDLGRQRRHLPTSSLSIDSGDPAISTDRPCSIMHISRQIIQGCCGVENYWRILRLAPDISRCWQNFNGQFLRCSQNSRSITLSAKYILLYLVLKNTLCTGKHITW